MTNRTDGFLFDDPVYTRLARRLDLLPVVATILGGLVPYVAGLCAILVVMSQGRPLVPIGTAILGLLPASIGFLLAFLALGTAGGKWARRAVSADDSAGRTRLWMAYGGVAGAAAAACAGLLYMLVAEPTGPYGSSIEIMYLVLVLAPHYVLGVLFAGLLVGGGLGWVADSLLPVNRES